MTDVAASDFRHPRRYVRLDTILRLRWLAVLGQLAAIFIVAQGLEFDVEVAPCVDHHRPVGPAQSRAADRLQPDAAAGAGLCRGAARAEHRRAGGAAVFHRRAGESVLVPVSRAGADLGDGAADPAHHRARGARGRLRLGCWSTSICRCRGTATIRWCCRRSICSASGSRSRSRSASPASMRSRSPRKRASSPTRWPPPSWC